MRIMIKISTELQLWNVSCMTGLKTVLFVTCAVLDTNKKTNV